MQINDIQLAVQSRLLHRAFEVGFQAPEGAERPLGNTMEQSRLNSLYVICIERVYAILVLKNDIINVLTSCVCFLELVLYESFWFEFATQLL